MVSISPKISTSDSSANPFFSPFSEGFGLNVDSDGSYPFQYGEGLNFTMNLAIDTIDFGTLHLYPSSCKYSPTYSSNQMANPTYKFNRE